MHHFELNRCSATCTLNLWWMRRDSFNDIASPLIVVHLPLLFKYVKYLILGAAFNFWNIDECWWKNVLGQIYQTCHWVVWQIFPGAPSRGKNWMTRSLFCSTSLWFPTFISTRCFQRMGKFIIHILAVRSTQIVISPGNFRAFDTLNCIIELFFVPFGACLTLRR